MTLHPRWLKTAGGLLVPKAGISQMFAFYHLTSAPATAWPTTMGNEATWNEVDLRDGAHWNGYDPGLENHEAIKAIRADGLMIITHHGVAGTADLQVAYRAGDGVDGFHPGNYQLQAIEATTSAGVRIATSTLIPVFNGKFDVYWKRSHPSDATFPAGVNFKIREVYY